MVSLRTSAHAGVAISLVNDVIASQCAHWRGNPLVYKIISYKSSQLGFLLSTNLSFLFLFQPFICFSRSMAALTSGVDS